VQQRQSFTTLLTPTNIINFNLQCINYPTIIDNNVLLLITVQNNISSKIMIN